MRISEKLEIRFRPLSHLSAATIRISKSTLFGTLILLLLYQPTPWSIQRHHHRRSTSIIEIQGSSFTFPTLLFAFANENSEHDILEELLADERKHHEELEQLEAEMKHLNELEQKRDAQQREFSSTKQRIQPGNRGKVGLGSNSPTNASAGIKNKAFDRIEEDLRSKEAQMNEAKRKVNEEADKELKRKEAERLALQREAQFQAELERLSDEKKKKALLKDKRRDARIVKRILRHYENERHYHVLGMRCKWGTIQLGPLSLCKTTAADVKRAYRNAARLVHPDKNRDGRAGEAFDALDKSAAILMDDKLRKDYDSKMKKKRMDALQKGIGKALEIWTKTLGVADGLRKILGPLAFPIIILLVLMI